MDNKKIIDFFVKDIGKTKAKYLAKTFYDRTFFDGSYNKADSPSETLYKIFIELDNNQIIINGMEEFLDGLLEELAEKYDDCGASGMYYIEEYDN